MIIDSRNYRERNYRLISSTAVRNIKLDSQMRPWRDLSAESVKHWAALKPKPKLYNNTQLYTCIDVKAGLKRSERPSEWMRLSFNDLLQGFSQQIDVPLRRSTTGPQKSAPARLIWMPWLLVLSKRHDVVKRDLKSNNTDRTSEEWMMMDGWISIEESQVEVREATKVNSQVRNKMILDFWLIVWSTNLNVNIYGVTS